MQVLMRWALAPVMRAWAITATWGYDGIPRPTDAPQAHSPGIDSDRILIFGSGPAVGWGVLSHDLALPGSLARALTARTRRGADVDVVSGPFTTAGSAPTELRELRMSRYDAIVVFLGVHEATRLVSLRSWRRQLSAVLRLLGEGSSRSTHIFVMGIQPIRSVPIFDSALGSVAARHARALNRETARICAGEPRTLFIPLTAAGSSTAGRFRSPADYSRWASTLADRMAGVLDSEHLEFDGSDRPAGHHPEWLESDRQRAVDELGILDTDTDPQDRFARIVALAQRSFGTRSAAFTLIDRGRLWDKAGVGPGAQQIPRGGSASEVAIQGNGPLVVPDTHADERFRDHPLVLGEPHTRFYAGFPIESASGERIGVLSVFDPEPRRAEDVDRVLLRELALMLQAELRRSAGTPTDAAAP